MQFTSEEFTRHHAAARKAILGVLDSLRAGMKPTLAVAFALVDLDFWRRAHLPKVRLQPDERRQIRLIQALQLAVAHYELPDVVEQLGEEEAKALAAEHLAILHELTGP